MGVSSSPVLARVALDFADLDHGGGMWLGEATGAKEEGSVTVSGGEGKNRRRRKAGDMDIRMRWAPAVNLNSRAKGSAARSRRSAAPQILANRQLLHLVSPKFNWQPCKLVRPWSLPFPSRGLFEAYPYRHRSVLSQPHWHRKPPEPSPTISRPTHTDPDNGTNKPTVVSTVAP